MKKIFNKKSIFYTLVVGTLLAFFGVNKTEAIQLYSSWGSGYSNNWHFEKIRVASANYNGLPIGLGGNFINSGWDDGADPAGWFRPSPIVSEYNWKSANTYGGGNYSERSVGAEQAGTVSLAQGSNGNKLKIGYDVYGSNNLKTASWGYVLLEARNLSTNQRYTLITQVIGDAHVTPAQGKGTIEIDLVSKGLPKGTYNFRAVFAYEKHDGSTNVNVVTQSQQANLNNQSIGLNTISFYEAGSGNFTVLDETGKALGSSVTTANDSLRFIIKVDENYNKSTISFGIGGSGNISTKRVTTDLLTVNPWNNGTESGSINPKNYWHCELTNINADLTLIFFGITQNQCTLTHAASEFSNKIEKIEVSTNNGSTWAVLANQTFASGSTVRLRISPTSDVTGDITMEKKSDYIDSEWISDFGTKPDPSNSYIIAFTMPSSNTQFRLGGLSQSNVRISFVLGDNSLKAFNIFDIAEIKIVDINSDEEIATVNSFGYVNTIGKCVKFRVYLKNGFKSIGDDLTAVRNSSDIASDPPENTWGSSIIRIGGDDYWEFTSDPIKANSAIYISGIMQRELNVIFENKNPNVTIETYLNGIKQIVAGITNNYTDISYYGSSYHFRLKPGDGYRFTQLTLDEMNNLEITDPNKFTVYLADNIIYVKVFESSDLGLINDVYLNLAKITAEPIPPPTDESPFKVVLTGKNTMGFYKANPDGTQLSKPVTDVTDTLTVNSAGNFGTASLTYNPTAINSVTATQVLTASITDDTYNLSGNILEFDPNLEGYTLTCSYDYDGNSINETHVIDSNGRVVLNNTPDYGVITINSIEKTVTTILTSTANPNPTGNNYYNSDKVITVPPEFVEATLTCVYDTATVTSGPEYVKNNQIGALTFANNADVQYVWIDSASNITIHNKNELDTGILSIEQMSIPVINNGSNYLDGSVGVAPNPNAKVFKISGVQKNAEIVFKEDGDHVITIKEEIEPELNGNKHDLAEFIDYVNYTDNIFLNQIGNNIDLNARNIVLEAGSPLSLTVGMKASLPEAYNKLTSNSMSLISHDITPVSTTPTANSKTWDYPVLTSDVTLTLGGFKINEYTITLPTLTSSNNGVTLSVVTPAGGVPYKIKHGEEFVFTTTIKPDYDLTLNSTVVNLYSINSNSPIRGTINNTIINDIYNLANNSVKSYESRLTDVKNDCTLSTGFTTSLTRGKLLVSLPDDVQFLNTTNGSSTNVSSGTTITNIDLNQNFTFQIRNNSGKPTLAATAFRLEENSVTHETNHTWLTLSYNTPQTSNVYNYTITPAVLKTVYHVEVGVSGTTTYNVNFSFADTSLNTNKEQYMSITKRGSTINEVAGDIVVKENNTTTFKLKPKYPYDRCVPLAKIGDRVLNFKYESDGYYFTTPEITSNTTVTITDMYINEYEVKFAGENFTPKNTSGTDIRLSGLKIKHNVTTTQFDITADTGFDPNAITITSWKYNTDFREPNDENPALVAISPVSVSGQTARFRVNSIIDDTTLKIDVPLKKYDITFVEIGALNTNGDKKFTVRPVDADSGVLELGGDVLKVPHQKSVDLEVILDEKYDQSNLTFGLNFTANPGSIKVLTSDTPGVFIIRLQVTALNTVNIGGFEINRYNISFPNDPQVLATMEFLHETQDSLINQSTQITVVHGTPYTFRARVKYGYDLSSTVIRENHGRPLENGQTQYPEIVGVLAGDTFVYTINSVRGHTAIETEPASLKKYRVRFEVANANVYSIDATTTNSTPINLMPESDPTLNLNSYPYVVEHGKPYSFRISEHQGYNLGRSTFLTNTGVLVLPVQGASQTGALGTAYTTGNITADTTILISNITKNEYPITFKLDSNSGINNKSLGDLIEIYDENGNASKAKGSDLIAIATDGNDFKFSFVLKDAVNRSTNLTYTTNILVDPSDTAQTVPITTDNDLFVLDELYINEENGDPINAGIVITISGIELNQYPITFEGEGVKFVDNNGQVISEWTAANGQETVNAKTITHSGEVGSELVFRVQADTDNGFIIDTDLNVFATSGQIKHVQDIRGVTGQIEYREYTLNQVFEDTTVYVENVKSKLHKVTFVNESGNNDNFTVTSDQEWNLTAGTRAEHESSIRFRIAPDARHNKSNFRVTIPHTSGDLELTPDGDGYYTLSNIAQDTIVTIRDLTLNVYNITFVRTSDQLSKFSYFNNLSNTELTSETAKHGESFAFRIGATKGYNLSNIKVNAPNTIVGRPEALPDEILPTVKVNLQNITGDTEVTVADVALDLYDINFVDENGNALQNARVLMHGNLRNITDGTYVNFGGELQFTVDLNEGFTRSDLTVTTNTGDITRADPNTNNFVLSNVGGNTDVKISGITRNNYNLLIDSIEPDVINETTIYKWPRTPDDSPLSLGQLYERQVLHGDKFEFEIITTTGFTPQNMAISVESAQVSITQTGPNNAVVALSDVTGDLILRIKNISKRTFFVSFTDESTQNLDVFSSYESNNVQALRNISKSGADVMFGSDFVFKIDPHFGYEQCMDEITIDGAERYLDGGVNHWVLRNVSADTVLTINGIRLNRYLVNFEGANVNFVNFITNDTLTDNEKTATHGGFLTFKIVAQNGFDLSNMGINTTVGDLAQESKTNFEAVYTLNNITSAPTVLATADQSLIMLSFMQNEGVTFRDEYGDNEISGIKTVPFGHGYVFRVYANHGYDINSLQVKLNNTVIMPVDATDAYAEFFVYELQNLTENAKITVQINKMNYMVSLPTVSGARFFENGVQINSPSVMIKYGDMFKFSIVLNPEYNQSTPVVSANNEEIPLIDGVYSLMATSGDIKITVENVNINRYTVNLAENTGAYFISPSANNNISGMQTITHGGMISFRIAAREGYNISDMAVVCKEEDGTKTSPIYTAGVYTIPNITNNKTVTIEEVNKIQYKLSFNETPGLIYRNDLGTVISEPIYITHGTNFEFQISIASEYDESVPVVTTSSNKIMPTKLSPGKYVLSDITEDINITVSNVVKNRYTISFAQTIGVQYFDQNNRTIEGERQVEHGSDFWFGVGLLAAYNSSKISVMQGNNVIEPDESGMYKLPNVIQNLNITVFGVTENDEVKLINEINNLNSTVLSVADVDAVVSATRKYLAMPEEMRKYVTNAEKLFSLQKLAGEFNHTTNGVTMRGVDWHIKLIANSVSTSSEPASRIYEQLTSEFILSLYNVTLWNLLDDQRYILPEEKTIEVDIPSPDMTTFINPTIVHERPTDGKVENLIMTSSTSAKKTFEMKTLGFVGVAAQRSTTPGAAVSSFFDEIGINLSAIDDVVNNVFTGGDNNQEYREGNGGSGNQNNNNQVDSWFSDTNPVFGGMVSSKAQGRGLIILLVLIIGTIAVIIVLIYVKKHKKRK